MIKTLRESCQDDVGMFGLNIDSVEYSAPPVHTEDRVRGLFDVNRWKMELVRKSAVATPDG